MSDINVSEANPAPADETERFRIPVPIERPNTMLWALIVVQFGLIVGFTCWRYLESRPVVTSSVKGKVEISEEINLHQADELLRDGDYSGALDIYLKHADREKGRQLPYLLYRTALCLEGKGHWEEAKKKYVELTNRSDDANSVAAAGLGQARALLGLNSPAGAKDVLTSLWERLPPTAKSSRPYRADLHYLLGLAMAWDVLKADEAGSIAAKDLPVDGRAAFELPIRHCIDWVRQPGDESVGDSAEDLPGLPENVAADDRSELEQAEAVLRVAIDTYPDHPFAPMARLEYGNLAYLSSLDQRGDFEQRFNDLQKAIVRYEDMFGPESTPITVLAAFNQGMAYKRQRDFKAAQASFDRVIDGHPGSGLAPAALVQIGRMLLNKGKYEEAHMPLERAALLEAPGEVGAEAVIYLAVALLSMENDFDTRRANALLFGHRGLLRQQPRYSNANAFFTAYVGYRLLTRQSRREREAGFLLNAILALGDNPVWLDSSAVLLMGRAAKDLGVETLMARLYEKRRTLAGDTVSLEIEFRLHDYRYRQADINAAIPSPAEADKARRALEDLADGDEGGRWGREAQTRLADIWLLEQEPDKCLEECRLLLKQVSPHREVILKLMGRAYRQQADVYQQQGELEKQKAALENAVRCFSGMVPEDFDSAPEDSEPSPEQPE